MNFIPVLSLYFILEFKTERNQRLLIDHTDSNGEKDDVAMKDYGYVLPTSLIPFFSPFPSICKFALSAILNLWNFIAISDYQKIALLAEALYRKLKRTALSFFLECERENAYNMLLKSKIVNCVQ